MWEDLLRPIDIYCERTDSTWWSEPLGLSSNLGFFVVAYLMWRLALRLDFKDQDQPTHSRELRYLSLVTLAIACGSSLFHAQPNLLTKLADVIPIATFALVFLGLYLRQRLREGVSLRPLLANSLLLLALPPLIARWADSSPFWAGGEAYLGLGPAMLYLASTDKLSARAAWLMRSSLLFLLALTARTLDLHLCAELTFGTHFVWHLLNAVVIYGLARTLATPSLQPRS